MPQHVIHFGAVPVGFGEHITLNGTRYPEGAHAKIQNSVFLAGSWSVWGEGPNNENDRSLHIVQEVNEDWIKKIDSPFGPQQKEVRDLLVEVLRDKDRLITRGRLADYAVITEHDWSVQTHMVTWDYGFETIYFTRTAR